MGYSLVMEFGWDDAKSEACFRERGFDFAYVASAFADPDRVVVEDTRRPCGEPRFELTGQVQGRLFVLVFTPRRNVIRIISARKANSREIRQHENRSQGDGRP